MARGDSRSAGMDVTDSTTPTKKWGPTISDQFRSQYLCVKFILLIGQLTIHRNISWLTFWYFGPQVDKYRVVLATVIFLAILGQVRIVRGY